MEEKADRRLSAKEYERFAAASDRLTADMDTALLGLVGEVGSLVDAGDIILVKGSKGAKVSLVVDAFRKLGQSTAARGSGR